ncbi:histone deacetylase HDT3-like [Patiria miniata]|uniref:EKC/KEOPS complex subunit GON7 n=1 Tax=Patiria miniata TaxID=46514 RepID=A0A914BBZ2_PATMI|nr:histone deacetylase HDT3-like [Patiria miniata]
MAAPMVTSTVTLRSGEKQEFSHQIQSNSDAITHDKLRESIQVIQKEVNEYLTVQVDLEKGSKSNDLSNDDNADEEGEEEEENEDEDEEDEGGTNGEGQGDREPPPKKPKK